MSFIVAYPETFVTFPTISAAREFADKIRTVHHVKILQVREVEHLFPSGPKGAPDPTPPPAGVPEIEEEEIAA